MKKIIKVRGGERLEGSIKPIPNKNAILKTLIASLLTEDVVTYYDVPNTSDVKLVLEMLESLGAKITQTTETTKIECKNISNSNLNKDLASKFRSVILFVGPLLAKFGKVEIPLPGGCVLGYRSIAAHVDAFRKAGVEVELKNETAVFTEPKNLSKTALVWQLEESVTATENIMMYAAGKEREIEIMDAACEPHTVQLGKMLVKMGAKIEGLKSNRIKIKGTGSLKGTEFKPQPDHVDIHGYIIAAALTKGKIRIEGGNEPEVMNGLLNWMDLFGIEVQKEGKDLIAIGPDKLKIDINKGFPLAGKDMPKLVPRPWPGFPIDCLPPMVTLACKTQGKVMIQNWMYETGLQFIDQLNMLGANIFMADPQKIVVFGPNTFTGGKVVAPGIIQATKALFLAALTDKAETIIEGVEVLERRYPNIIESYNKLGAKIELI